MDDAEFDGEKAVKILGHPLRIKIIELLAKEGPLSWKELSKELGTSTGALYHHIDVLERMVEQDPSKRYVLTKLGTSVYHYMEANSPRDAVGLNRLIRQKSAASVVRGIVIPRSLLYSLTSSRSRAAGTLAGVCSLVLTMIALSRSEILLFAFSPSPGVLQSAASFGGSLAVLTGVSYAGSRTFDAKVDAAVLLASTSVAFLPLAAFSLILHALASQGSLGVLSDRNALTLVFTLLQGWSACIAGAAISVGSGLRVEKALLVSLVVLYVTILTMFVQGLRFI